MHQSIFLWNGQICIYKEETYQDLEKEIARREAARQELADLQTEKAKVDKELEELQLTRAQPSDTLLASSTSTSEFIRHTDYSNTKIIKTSNMSSITKKAAILREENRSGERLLTFSNYSSTFFVNETSTLTLENVHRHQKVNNKALKFVVYSSKNFNGS